MVEVERIELPSSRTQNARLATRLHLGRRRAEESDLKPCGSIGLANRGDPGSRCSPSAEGGGVEPLTLARSPVFETGAAPLLLHLPWRPVPELNRRREVEGLASLPPRRTGHRRSQRGSNSSHSIDNRAASPDAHGCMVRAEGLEPSPAESESACHPMDARVKRGCGGSTRTISRGVQSASAIPVVAAMLVHPLGIEPSSAA